MSLIFVDTEADGPCPGKGVMTEFGAVELESRQTFHGVLWETEPELKNFFLTSLLFMFNVL
jgi:hypothetical protein